MLLLTNYMFLCSLSRGYTHGSPRSRTKEEGAERPPPLTEPTGPSRLLTLIEPIPSLGRVGVYPQIGSTNRAVLELLGKPLRILYTDLKSTGTLLRKSGGTF